MNYLQLKCDFAERMRDEAEYYMRLQEPVTIHKMNDALNESRTQLLHDCLLQLKTKDYLELLTEDAELGKLSSLKVIQSFTDIIDKNLEERLNDLFYKWLPDSIASAKEAYLSTMTRHLPHKLKDWVLENVEEWDLVKLYWEIKDGKHNEELTATEQETIIKEIQQ